MRTRVLCLLSFCLFLVNTQAFSQAPAEIALPVLFVHGICGGADDFLPADRDVKTYLLSHYPSYYTSSLDYVAFYDGTSVKYQVPKGELTPGFPNPALTKIDPASRFFLVALDDNTQSSYDKFDPVNVANRSIEEKGDELAQIVWAVKTLTGAPRVIVIGHSQGGLDTRAYIEGLGTSDETGATDAYFNDIATLITLDTPHGGTIFANLPDLPILDWVFCVANSTLDRSEMDPSGPFMQELNYSSGQAADLPQGLNITPIASSWSALADVLAPWLAYKGTDSVLSAGEQDLATNLTGGTAHVQSELTPDSNVFNEPFITLQSDPLDCGDDDILHLLSCTGSSPQTFALLESGVDRISQQYSGPLFSSRAMQVTPATGTVAVGKSASFTAVTASGQAPIWSILEGGIGGSITQSGEYQAPGQIVRSSEVFHVVAIDSGHTDQFAEAAVTVTLPSGGGIPTTGSATSINSNSATVSGTVNPKGDAGWAYFLWSANPGLAEASSNCNYNSSPPNNGCALVLANSSAQAFNHTLTELASGTTYYYRAAFYNSTLSTTQLGPILSFTTRNTVIATGSATSITSSSATISGIVNMYGSTGFSYFLWSTDPGLANPSSNCNYTNPTTGSGCPAVTASSTPEAYNAGLTGLATDTTYYYQIGSYNLSNGGTQLGPILSFTTLPTVTATAAATAVLNSSATIGGSVITNGSAGFSFLVWDTNAGIENPSSNCNFSNPSNSGCPALIASSSAQAFTVNLTGLAGGTVYYFRAGFYNGSNSSMQLGPTRKFTTLATTAVTGAASAITSNSAKIAGKIDPNGSTGFSFFVWGTDSAILFPNANCNFSNPVPNNGCPTVSATTTPQPFSTAITSLASATTYYYRLCFYDFSNYTSQCGAILNFTTLGTLTTTTAASAINSNSAVIGGTVNPNGSTGFSYLIWSTDSGLASPGSNCDSSSYSPNNGCPAVKANSTPQAFSYTLTGLASNTTYYYRMNFYNSSNGGFQSGPILSFKTLATVTSTGAATKILNSSVTLGGSVSPTGSTGYSYFLWSADPGLANPTPNCNWPSESQNNGCPAVTAGTAAQVFTVSPTGLAANTAYYYQLNFFNASNGSTQFGAIRSFQTLPTASVFLYPTSLDFGTILAGTVSTARTVTATNTGGVAMGITGIGLTGANPGSFTTSNNCGASLAAGASCTITVKFAPAIAGPFAAAVTLTDSAGNSPQSIALKGAANGPVVLLSATSLTFPAQGVNTQSATQSILLTNIGGAPLSIAGIALTGTNAAEFKTSNNCGTSLAAGADCTIGVSFYPSAKGAAKAALTLTDNATGSPQSVTLAGTGQ